MTSAVTHSSLYQRGGDAFRAAWLAEHRAFARAETAELRLPQQWENDALVVAFPASPFDTTLEMDETRPTPLTLVSGGADGADYCWASQAVERQLPVLICTFAGHHRQAPVGTDVHLVKLQTGHYTQFERDLNVAAARLGRPRVGSMPAYVRKLLMRNALIARRSQVMLAVIERPPHEPVMGRHPRSLEARDWDCGVPGGTGWTVQLCCDLAIAHHRQPRLAIFVQSTTQWYMAQLDFEQQSVVWRPVACPIDAVLCQGSIVLPQRVGGVGVRGLRQTGRVAINCAVQALQTLYADRPAS